MEDNNLTDLLRCESIAQNLVPRSRRKGAGVSHTYSTSDLDCKLCAYYVKSTGCTEPVCCCAEERAAAGCFD